VQAPEPAAPPLYVSYSHVDKEFVTPVVHWLRERGVPLWFDQDLQGGAHWPSAIGRVRDAARLWLVFIGQRPGENQKDEMGENSPAHQRLTLARDLRVVPVILPGVSWQQAPVYLAQLHGMSLSSNRDPEQLQQLERRLWQALGAERSDSPRPAQPVPPEVMGMASAEQLPALLARLALRDRHALPVLATPDVGTLRTSLRNAGVATHADLLGMAGSLASEHAHFTPHALWSAWMQQVHGDRLEDLGAELTGLGAEATAPAPPPAEHAHFPELESEIFEESAPVQSPPHPAAQTSARKAAPTKKKRK
jgi:hypothetical protein